MMTSRGFRPHRQPLYKVSEQTCAVWCVTTTTGTWMARRNGTVYFTGNCVGGRATTTIPDFYDRYGLVHAARTPELLCESNNLAMEQAMAILKPGGHLLVKCQDYVSSGKLFLGTHWTLTAALGMGLECCERFEHVGHARAQPPGRRQVHARRNLSTLFIFRKPRKDRRGSTPTFA